MASAFDIDSIPNFGRISKAIHEDDEMFKASRASLTTPGEPFRHYFYSAWQMSSRMDTFLRQIGKNPQNLDLLDFACGYGRLTRFFVNSFRSVTCSDLEQSMLDFNKEKHGTDGFLSNVEPSRIQWPACKFDIAFSFSLFTHLPPRTWGTWFWSLFETVQKGGLLIITTRPIGMAIRAKEEIKSDDFITYGLRNETRGRIAVDHYGTTTTRTKFIDDVVYSRPKDIERIALYPAGTMDAFQDTHVFMRVL